MDRLAAHNALSALDNLTSAADRFLVVAGHSPESVSHAEYGRLMDDCQACDHPWNYHGEVGCFAAPDCDCTDTQNDVGSETGD
jgi:hypothetical protein